MTSKRALRAAFIVAICGLSASCATREREEAEYPETLVDEQAQALPAPKPEAQLSAQGGAEKDEVKKQAPREATGNRAIDPAVQSFIDWAGNFDAKRMGLSHDYTSTGIRRMAAALRALSGGEEDAKTKAKLDKLDTLGERLVMSSVESTKHADIVHEAFVLGAEIMSDMGRTRFAADAELGRKVATLGHMATAVDPKHKLLDQRDRVRDYFNQARDAVAQMARSGATR